METFADRFLGLVILTSIAIFNFLVVYSLVTGKAPSRRGTADRSRNPGSYLYNLGFLVLCAGLMDYVLIMSLWNGRHGR